MGKEEIIERLAEIAKHAVHVLGEEPFFMSLDDGIAIHEAIDILKSAQPERKKGKWITSHVPESILWECNQCGFPCGAHSFNFCPNCGSDNRGDQQS